MRIRTVKPEFWAHPVMARRDDSTRLLAIGLLNFADDEGYFYADPSLIRSALRPFDDSSTIIRRGLEELAKIGYIEVRENATHGAIGRVVNFLDHQKIDRPKASPVKGLFDSSIDRRTLDDDSSLYGKGTREQGNKGKGREDFAEFWKCYPNKVGKAKAEEAWKKVTVDLSVITAAINRQRFNPQWVKDGGQFIPNPATWLNQKRWEDEGVPDLAQPIPHVPNYETPVDKMLREAEAAQ